MGANFDASFDSSGAPQLFYIDKGSKIVNVGSKLSDFIIKKQLGKGNFGSVYLVESRLTNKLYAMKEIKLEMYNPKQRAEVQREVKILQEMNHPHVIKFFAHFKENQNFYIITEYVNGGNLDDLYTQTHKEGKLLTEKIIWDFLIQTLSGLVYLHEKKKIVHRDIKPDNLLLEKNHDLKISDFGVSAVIASDADDSVKCHGTTIGPIQFMSPEMWFEKPYDFKNDIYMLGLCFFMVMSGKLPEKKFEGESGRPRIFRLNNLNKLLPDYYSETLKNFIEKLLTFDAEERPSSREAFASAVSHYSIKYLKITSILATLECLSALPILSGYFKSDRMKERIKKDEKEGKYKITKIIKNALDYADPNNFNYKNVRLECLRLRTIFYTRPEWVEKSLEVDIISIFEDICNNLHRELNKVDLTASQIAGKNTINEGFLDDTGKKIDEDDEKTVVKYAAQKFADNFKSKISDQLYFLVKIIHQCPECETNIKYLTTFHCAYCLRPERCALWLNKKSIDLNDLFKHLRKSREYENINLNCKRCGKMQKDINITKIFYTCPLNLILCFDYTNEDTFEFKIEESMNMSNFVERSDICKTQYRLVGAIFTEESEEDKNHEKYVSYTKDINNQWKFCDGKSIKNCNFNELSNHKHIQALFYTTY